MLKTEKTDVIVIGAGLLGCFAARSLREYNLSVRVLEAREDVCTGISRANTAIIYTGIDNKPGTLKSELCVRANENFDRLCSDLGVPFSRCGSLMPVFGPEGEKVLRKKYVQGMKNGVRGIRLLSAEETLSMEPNLSPNVRASLYVPGTGTVNPWHLCIAAYENADANGADFCFNSKAVRMERIKGGFRVTTEENEFFAGAVVNCAGLSADTVREMTEKPLVRIFRTGADYFVMDKKSEGGVSHIIFHEPESGNKGLTLVPTIEGNILAGSGERDAADVPDSADLNGLLYLEHLCGEVVPKLDMKKRIRSFAGARPNPFIVEPEGSGFRKTDRSIRDFSIFEEEGLFSLVGIKTPGLTCAHELSKYISVKVADYLGCSEKNSGFCPVREPVEKVSELTFEEWRRVVLRNPAYGRIVCKCGVISEGEIVEAIARGAKTVNGVKRRIGTGMGRCQGSRCTMRIAELIARELSLPVSEVTLNGGISNYVKGGGPGEV